MMKSGGMMGRTSAFLAWVFTAALVTIGSAPAGPGASGGGDEWVGTWAASQQLTEDANLPPPPGFADTTLRQVVHVSIGGSRLRVRFSNTFGRTALTLRAVRIARSAGGGAIHPASNRALTFRGRSSVTIPEGALIVSDPVDFDLVPLKAYPGFSRLFRDPIP